jgi:hypothetical protein
MSAKKIATSLPRAQFVALERTRKRLELQRSEAIQQALEMWLAAQDGDARVSLYIEGYLRHPDDPREATAYAKAWAQGVDPEDW